jgi:hypothetical protein
MAGFYRILAFLPIAKQRTPVQTGIKTDEITDIYDYARCLGSVVA